MQLVVTPTGTIRCLYDETLDVHVFGRLDIQRGSHVEPTNDGHWQADLSPVSGPFLGPFALRSQALDAEREWLEANWLICPDDLASRP
ncbi:MAG: hypothetical protein K8T91_06825 [Planctomycetes bacterium]|nr:hypothetical protein [Planctomycetota bacterium]